MPAPMIDDIELTAVQVLRQETAQGFQQHAVAGLPGTLQQSLGRRSHCVVAAGLLVSDTAFDDLRALQGKAAGGEEVTFVADITSALEIQKMVIESFAAEQVAGPDKQIAYALRLVESPELPPPAEVGGGFGGFGGLDGLDGFGLGDLGFDPGALADIANAVAEQAGAVLDAVDAVAGALDQLSALASLGDLGSIGNPAQPVVDALGGIADNSAGLAKSTGAAAKLVGG